MITFALTANCCAGKYAEDARKCVFGPLCAWLRSSQASCETITFSASVNSSNTFLYVIVHCMVWRFWNAVYETWILNDFIAEGWASSQSSPIHVGFVEKVALKQFFFLPFTWTSVVSIFPPMFSNHFIHVPFTLCNRRKFAVFNET